jgi:hypothetical protein
MGRGGGGTLSFGSEVGSRQLEVGALPKQMQHRQARWGCTLVAPSIVPYACLLAIRVTSRICSKRSCVMDLKATNALAVVQNM